MLTNRRAFGGLLLSAALLGATWPTLMALPALPSRVLAGDVYAITQGSGPSSINESLAENLTAQPWADLVSPEMLALGTVRGSAVVVRAADPRSFLAIEGGTWVEPPDGQGGIASGAGLAERVGLRIGDFVTLAGSTVPRIEIVRVAGTFDGPGPSREELLADFALGRSLTALSAESYHTIRVRTADPTSLLEFLDASRASVHVTGPGLPRADVRSDPPMEDPLANLILRSGRGSIPKDYLSVAVGDATASVRVVAFGIAALIGGLVALSIHGVQRRAFADASRSVGVLRAVGATDRWMRARIVREGIPLALLAGSLGAGLGYVADALLRPTAALILFGHAVRPSFDVGTFGLAAGAIVAASTVSSLGLLGQALRRRPAESIREAVVPEASPSLEVVLRG